MSRPVLPPQALPTEPHWIVVSLSKSRATDAVAEKGRGFRVLFRHPTEASANAECERLANVNQGRRFAVYASGISHEVDKPTPAPTSSHTEADVAGVDPLAMAGSAPAPSPESAPP